MHVGLAMGTTAWSARKLVESDSERRGKRKRALGHRLQKPAAAAQPPVQAKGAQQQQPPAAKREKRHQRST